eukprot:scaffold92533_cov69-Phaeocystis_antarctica.AAC.3
MAQGDDHTRAAPRPSWRGAAPPWAGCRGTAAARRHTGRDSGRGRDIDQGPAHRPALLWPRSVPHCCPRHCRPRHRRPRSGRPRSGRRSASA